MEVFSSITFIRDFAIAFYNFIYHRCLDLARILRLCSSGLWILRIVIGRFLACKSRNQRRLNGHPLRSGGKMSVRMLLRLGRLTDQGILGISISHYRIVG